MAVVPLTLNRTQAEALRRVRDYGPTGWAKGKGRAGGAVSRMFVRMREDGLVKGPPYELTIRGSVSLEAYDSTKLRRRL